MKFSPRNAAELRNVLLLISDYCDSRIEATFAINYDIGAEEYATRSEWCRCIADDVGFRNEVADDDLWTLAKELRGQMKRSQTFDSDDVAELMGRDDSWLLSDDEFQLHAKLVEFCRLMEKMCMNGFKAHKNSFERISRDVFDCGEAAFAKMTPKESIEFQMERNRVENERRAS